MKPNCYKIDVNEPTSCLNFNLGISCLNIKSEKRKKIESNQLKQWYHIKGFKSTQILKVKDWEIMVSWMVDAQIFLVVA